MGSDLDSAERFAWQRQREVGGRVQELRAAAEAVRKGEITALQVADLLELVARSLQDATDVGAYTLRGARYLVHETLKENRASIVEEVTREILDRLRVDRDPPG